jgi:hypothetical protein
VVAVGEKQSVVELEDGHGFRLLKGV